MRTVLFTKLFRGLHLDEVGTMIKTLEFDGVDLLVRPGHQLEPDRAGAIPAAVRRLEMLSLDVPMITTDLSDPAAYPADRVLGNCAEAGVRLIRLGYWRYDSARGHTAVFEEARHHWTSWSGWPGRTVSAWSCSSTGGRFTVLPRWR